ncbi:MAG: Ig-like domain-containing protein, partial [Planctomycetaceae bacterium]|nr:Ig-like domain-containing protein [Planctomycetaceae bacterium]
MNNTSTGVLSSAELRLQASSILTGTGTFAGNVVNEGTIIPGTSTTAGSLRITGDLQQLPGGTLAINLGGAAAGSGFDQLIVDGNVSLSGVLTTDRINSYVPAPGDQFDVVLGQSVSGQFTALSNSAIGGGIKVFPQYTATSAVLTASLDSGPRVVSVSAGGPQADSIRQFDVFFDEDVLASSFAATDITLAGPAGNAVVLSITQVTPRQYRIDVDDETAVGQYTLSIGPNITDLAGNPMDQDADGTNGEVTDNFETPIEIIAGEQSVLLVNVNGSLNQESMSVYQTLIDHGVRVKWVNLNAAGKADAALQRDTFDQVWLLDLSNGTDAYTQDWNAIAVWMGASNGQMIADSRIRSSFMSGRWETAGRRLSENYYENLKSRQGGLVLGTDDAVYHSGINSVAAAVGLSAFTGTLNVTEAAVDLGSPLVTTPNNLGVSLAADSTPGLSPSGLQPGGAVMHTAAWYSGDFSQAAVSSTIPGTTGFVIDIFSPANDLSVAEGDSVSFSAQHRNAVGAVTYTWSSDIDGVIGTGPTISVSNLSAGTHVITLTGSDSVGTAPVQTIRVTVVPLATVLQLDLNDAADTGVSNSDNLTRLTQLLLDVDVNKPGTISIDLNSDGTAELTRVAASAGRYNFTTPVLSEGTHQITAAFAPILGDDADDRLDVTIDTTGPRALAGAATEQAPTVSRTLRFSEPIVSLTSGVVVSLTGPNGVEGIQSVTGTGTTWDVTYNVLLTAGTYTLTAGATIQDLAGNLIDQNTNGTQGESPEDHVADTFQLLADVTPPHPLLSGPVSPTRNNPFVVTIDFQEDVTGFTGGDLTLTNGSLTGFTSLGGGRFLATVQAVASGEVVVEVPAGEATDLSGNVSSAATPLAVVADTVAPQPVITGPASPTKNDPFVVTVDFGEVVNGFTASDLAVTNGNIRGLADNGNGLFT